MIIKAPKHLINYALEDLSIVPVGNRGKKTAKKDKMIGIHVDKIFEELLKYLVDELHESHVLSSLETRQDYIRKLVLSDFLNRTIPHRKLMSALDKEVLTKQLE